MRRTSRRRSISLHSSTNERRSKITTDSEYVFHDTSGQSWPNIEDLVLPLERNLFGHPLAGLLWERQLRKFHGDLDGKKVPNWDSLFVHRKQGLFLSVYVDDKNLAGRKQNLRFILEEIDEAGRPWRTSIIFMTTCIWDVLNVNAHRTRILLRTIQRCLNHVFLLEQLKNYLGGTKLAPKQSLGSDDMESHAKRCVESYCELANKKPEQLYKSSLLHACSTITSKRKNLRRSKNCPKYADSWSKNACTQPELVDPTFLGP